jgi:isopropylmalate/homocitrate/citramalate synthase
MARRDTFGERAGKTSLEEVVMAIHTHPSFYPVKHNIDTYQKFTMLLI